MKFLHIVIVCLVLVALTEAKKRKHNRTSHPKWRNHSSKHKLNFRHDQEEIDAFQRFHDLDDHIESHNNNDTYAFKMGHNEFSTWSDEEHNKHRGLVSLEEFLNKRGAGPDQMNQFGHLFQFYTPTPGYVPPASVDWVKAGWNTPVRHQQQCGDCWAFATTASIEAALWVKRKVSVTLSPQQLTDCAFSYGNNGCRGGVVFYGYDYATDNGLVEDRNYPFYGRETSCNYNNLKARSLPMYKVSKYYWIQPGSDAALMEVLAKYGPVSVGIDSSGQTFQNYKTGIYAKAAGVCSQKIDHAVLLTGYGTDSAGNKYWIIKNQWGNTWGNNGYMLVSRDRPNNCGISSQAGFPIV